MRFQTYGLIYQGREQPHHSMVSTKTGGSQLSTLAKLGSSIIWVNIVLGLSLRLQPEEKSFACSTVECVVCTWKEEPNLNFQRIKKIINRQTRDSLLHYNSKEISEILKY